MLKSLGRWFDSGSKEALFGKLPCVAQIKESESTLISHKWWLAENGCLGHVSSLIYIVFCVWDVLIMPITFDYLIGDLLLSTPLLISLFLIGGTH